MTDRQRCQACPAHAGDEPRGKPQPGAGLMKFKANCCLGGGGFGIIFDPGQSTHGDEHAVEQVARQFGQGQLHSPLFLAISRLSGQKPHGERGGFRIGRCHLRLQQRREHWIKRQPRVQLLGQLPFEGQSMEMAEQCRTGAESIGEHGDVLGRVFDPLDFAGRPRPRIKQLARQIADHPPHARYDRIGEH